MFDIIKYFLEHYPIPSFLVYGLAAYFITMFLIVYFEASINKNNVIPIVFFLFALMIFQVYLGAKFFKYQSKRSNALGILKMKRVNIKYEEHIEK
ncbi:hypothetical protein [Acinetobacter seifertii]|uniref:hypothetical protein n=1 Tax=Acinetobacter seifertii TaxID=1530123 RepID=UPI00124D384E|nr:hypothetical protein [Acinetobacter seifertii]